MILRTAGMTKSAKGESLSIGLLANYMQTDYYGCTNFATRSFMKGMNNYLGKSVYTSVHTPSYNTVLKAVMNSYRNGYAVAVDTVERRGGPHLNGHNNSTFYHIMVIDGYNQQTDQVYIADPGAGTVWGSSSRKFWYYSLKNFVATYMQNEVSYDREHIGVHYAK